MEVLTCYYNMISKREYRPIMIQSSRGGFFNQEKFFHTCLQLCNLFDKTKKIKNINYYWTAEMINGYHTWSTPHLHPRRKIISKYDGQCDEAYSNYDLWNSGNYSWGINEDDMSIELILNKSI